MWGVRGTKRLHVSAHRGREGGTAAGGGSRPGSRGKRLPMDLLLLFLFQGLLSKTEAATLRIIALRRRHVTALESSYPEHLQSTLRPSRATFSGPRRLGEGSTLGNRGVRSAAVGMKGEASRGFSAQEHKADLTPAFCGR